MHLNAPVRGPNCVDCRLTLAYPRPFFTMVLHRHFDPDDGFLALLTGRKRVRLFSPRHVNEMYINPTGSLGRTLQVLFME